MVVASIFLPRESSLEELAASLSRKYAVHIEDLREFGEAGSALYIGGSSVKIEPAEAYWRELYEPVELAKIDRLLGPNAVSFDVDGKTCDELVPVLKALADRDDCFVRLGSSKFWRGRDLVAKLDADPNWDWHQR